VFDRFTQKAKRVIFFSRLEAGNLGSPAIDPEHLLLGLLHEDKDLMNRVNATLEQIRQDIEERKPVGKKVPTAQDMPLSEECIRIMKYAAKESERLSLFYIGPEHLLSGLLQEEGSFAVEILKRHGFASES
jgi:ATP-dependent Clp protease ATP-binding subunit ClpC